MYKQINNDTLILSQQAIYGSSRLGVLERDEIVSIDSTIHTQTPTIPDPLTEHVTHWTRGHKRYELTNHLGNVLATVSDRKLPVYANNSFSYYKAEVMTANDYYAFGAQMPKRGFDTSDYRFGFSNYEKINEIYGVAKIIDMGDRWLDTRLGRTHRIDPHANKYPYESNYSYVGNNPIYFVDKNGADKTTHYKVIAKDGTTSLMTTTASGVKWQGLKAFNYSQNVTIDQRSGTTTIYAPVIDYSKNLGLAEGLKQTAMEADNAIKGNSNGSLNGIVNSTNIGIKGTVEFNKYSASVEAGVYSTAENNAGLYMNLTYDVSLSVGSNGVNASNTSIEVSGALFIKANSSNEFNKNPISNSNSISGTGNVQFGAVGFGASTDIPFNGEQPSNSFEIDLGKGQNNIAGGIKNSTTIQLKTETINLHGK